MFNPQLWLYCNWMLSSLFLKTAVQFLDKSNEEERWGLVKMDVIYMDIMTGVIKLFILVSTIVLIYLSVLSTSRSWGDGVKWMTGGYRYISQLEGPFNRVGENMVQHPSNYISILVNDKRSVWSWQRRYSRLQIYNWFY